MKHEYKEVFKKCHIGAKVHCSSLGNGTIVDYLVDDDYKIEILFDSGYLTMYTACGKRYEQTLHPTLSFGHKKDYVFDTGKPEFKYIPFVIKDKSAWCWVGNDILEVRNKHKKRKVIAQSGSRYCAICDGFDNDESTHVTTWRYAMECTPEEVLASKT